MLTIEQMIKIDKVFDVEGFEYKPSKYNSLDDQMRFTNGDYARRYDILSEEWKFDKYGDYIQRVIEAMNLTPDLWIQIKLSPDTGGAVAWKPYITGKCNLNGELYLDIDQAKEKAISFVLERI